MADKTSELILKIRERMTERAMTGAPYWTAPVSVSARSTAGCLLIGTLLERLPVEDASALCETLTEEQNEDGSWSSIPHECGDLSLTLEVVEALSASRHPNATDALEHAIEWLERHRDRAQIELQTLCLLGALTDLPRSRAERWLGPIGKWWLHFSKLRSSYYTVRPSLKCSLRILGLSKAEALGQCRDLLELQYVDGSWDGATRSTVMAMIALRHTGLNSDDSAFERGWRFLLANQAWRGNALVQNSFDCSNLLHATALRALIMTGAEPDIAATSIFTLLHQQRNSGGWSVGGLLPTDLFTTASALDALSFAGDLPVETLWARRRAALLLARAQRSDGGWPMLHGRSNRFQKLVGHRGSPLERSRADVTALAVQALAYASLPEPNIERVIENGVRYLLRTQHKDGLWRTDAPELDILTTGRAIEALLGAAPDKTRGVVTAAVRGILRRQREDGSWGSTHDTAWIVRALAGMPGVPVDVLKSGRAWLERSLDRHELAWRVDGAGLPLPVGETSPGASDLTTLWALEALAPVSAAAKTRRLAGRKSRSTSDRRL